MLNFTQSKITFRQNKTINISLSISFQQLIIYESL